MTNTERTTAMTISVPAIKAGDHFIYGNAAYTATGDAEYCGARFYRVRVARTRPTSLFAVVLHGNARVVYA